MRAFVAIDQAGEHATGVAAAAATAAKGAHHRGRIGDVGILHYDGHDRALVAGHRLEGHILCRLDRDAEAAGVLGGDEALGHEFEQPECEPDHRHGDEQREAAVMERNPERAFIEADARLQDSLSRAVENPVLGRVVDGFQKTAAEHGRERERHEARDENRRADGDGELVEQAPEHAAHEQHGDKHCDE